MRILALAAAAVALVCPPSRAAEERGPEFLGVEQLAGMVLEAHRSPRRVSTECQVISLLETASFYQFGPVRIIFALDADGAPVYGLAGERSLRTPKRTWASLPEFSYGDSVCLRGAGATRDGHTVVLVESVELTGKPGPTRFGTLEDVLAGPLPMPAALELTSGRRILGRVLGRDGASLRVRTALVETRVSAAQVKSAKRLAYGISCRADDDRLDFLTAFPIAGPANRLFASAAGRVEAEEIRGKAVCGVRSGRSFGLIVRIEGTGDVMVLLNAYPSKAGHVASKYAGRRIDAALRLRRGQDVVLCAKKSYLGLCVHGVSSAIMVREGEEVREPMPREDPEAGRIGAEMEAKLEGLLTEVRKSAAHAAKVASLDEVSRRVVLRKLARGMDMGYPGSAGVVLKVVNALPAAAVPSEVPAATIRRLFTADDEEERVDCAAILGLAGCREGASALAEALDLHPGTAFAKAAAEAIERIKLTPPQ